MGVFYFTNMPDFVILEKSLYFFLAMPLYTKKCKISLPQGRCLHNLLQKWDIVAYYFTTYRDFLKGNNLQVTFVIITNECSIELFVFMSITLCHKLPCICTQFVFLFLL